MKVKRALLNTDCVTGELTMLYKGKVVDEPNTWVTGELIGQDTIFQKFEPKESCCGVGIFKVIPETVEPIGKYWEKYFYNQGRKDLADEIIEYLEEEIDDYKNLDFYGTSGALECVLEHIQNLIKENEADKKEIMNLIKYKKWYSNLGRG